jgi:ribosomal protein L22
MTEKDYNPNQKENKAMAKQEAMNAKTTKKEVVGAKKEEKKTVKVPPKEKKITKPKVKRTEAVVNVDNLPISTKTSMAICRFIKYKEIGKAIADLEQVIVKKKAVPMKGEIPHRKGKIMSGRYPKNASEHFIRLLKSLLANSNVNEIENPVISEAIANIGVRPYGKSGRVRKKRTHVKIVAKTKKVKEKKK